MSKRCTMAVVSKGDRRGMCEEDEVDKGGVRSIREKTGAMPPGVEGSDTIVLDTSLKGVW